MPPLTTAEKIELGAVAGVPVLVAWLSARPQVTLKVGEVVAGVALLILVQGLCRDLWLLRQAKRRAAAAPPREAQCMCVESALGMTGLVAGIGLVAAGLEGRLLLSPPELAGVVGGAMLAGYLLKDFVFTRSPWRIYREKDHAQVIVRWRK